MGRKSAHTGMSPKDRSINLMDKFITKNANKLKDQPVLSARRKDPNIPVHMWPVKDQIEYWDSRTEADSFDDKYRAYSTWYAEVKATSGVYPATFMDFTSKLKPLMVEMWEKKMMPKQAILELRKHGVY
jgi:2,3-bisphosphoglycerate-independent phosphoglycerate mutase